MLEKVNNKDKHLTVHDRTYIEGTLGFEYTLKDISRQLPKDPTRISKKLKEIELQKRANYSLEVIVNMIMQ